MALKIVLKIVETAGLKNITSYPYRFISYVRADLSSTLCCCLFFIDRPKQKDEHAAMIIAAKSEAKEEIDSPMIR